MLYQAISYKVDPADADELLKYDGSIILERTKGEIAARCDKEAANFLAINLANDVAEGRRSVEDARKFYAESMMAMMKENKKRRVVRRRAVRTQPGLDDPGVPQVPHRVVRGYLRQCQQRPAPRKREAQTRGQDQRRHGRLPREQGDRREVSAGGRGEPRDEQRFAWTRCQPRQGPEAAGDEGAGAEQWNPGAAGRRVDRVCHFCCFTLGQLASALAMMPAVSFSNIAFALASENRYAFPLCTVKSVGSDLSFMPMATPVAQIPS